MEIGTEISHKIRSAIKAKLIELGVYVDDELPDYIMVMVANKKSYEQMCDDLNLFLGPSTDKFATWLHTLLNKLQTITADEQPSQSESATIKNQDPKKQSVVDSKKKTHGSEKRKSASSHNSRRNSDPAKSSLPAKDCVQSTENVTVPLKPGVTPEIQNLNEPIPSVPISSTETSPNSVSDPSTAVRKVTTEAVILPDQAAKIQTRDTQNKQKEENVEPELLVRADTDEFSEELSQQKDISARKVSDSKQTEEPQKQIKISSVAPQQRHTMQPRSVQLQMRAKTTASSPVPIEREDEENISQESADVIHTKDMATSPVGNNHTDSSPKARIVARVTAETSNEHLTTKSKLEEVADARIVQTTENENSIKQPTKQHQSVSSSDSKSHTKKKSTAQIRSSKSSHPGGKRSGSPLTVSGTVPVKKKSLHSRREITSPIRVGSVRPRRAITSPIRVGSVRPRRAITSPIRVEAYRPRRRITSPIRVESYRPRTVPRRPITSPIRVDNIYQKRAITSPIRVLSISERLGERIDLPGKTKAPSSVVIQKYIPDIEEEEYDPHNPAVGSVASVIKISRRASLPIRRQANKALLLRAVKEAEKSVANSTSLKPIKNQAVIRPMSQRVRDAPPYISVKGPLRTSTGLMSKSRRQEILQSFKYTIDNDSEPEAQFIIESSEEDVCDDMEAIQDSRYVECSDEEDSDAVMEIYEEDDEGMDNNLNLLSANVIEIQSSGDSILDDEMEQSGSESMSDSSIMQTQQDSPLQRDSDQSSNNESSGKKSDTSNDRRLTEEGPLLDELLEAEASGIDSNKEEESNDDMTQDVIERRSPLAKKCIKNFRIRVRKPVPDVRTKAIVRSHTKKLVQHLSQEKSVSESSSEPLKHLHDESHYHPADRVEPRKYSDKNIRIKCIQTTSSHPGIVKHNTEIVHKPVKIVEGRTRPGTLYSDMTPQPIKQKVGPVHIAKENVSITHVRPVHTSSHSVSQQVRYRNENVIYSPVQVKQRSDPDNSLNEPYRHRSEDYAASDQRVRYRSEKISSHRKSDVQMIEKPDYSGQPVKHKPELISDSSEVHRQETKEISISNNPRKHSIEASSSVQPHKRALETSSHSRPVKHNSDRDLPVDTVSSGGSQTGTHQSGVNTASVHRVAKPKVRTPEDLHRSAPGSLRQTTAAALHNVPVKPTPAENTKPVPRRHPPVDPSRKTKFIVTLDGVDEKYDEIEGNDSTSGEIDFENYPIDFESEPEPEAEKDPPPVRSNVPKKIRLPRIQPLSINIGSTSDEDDDSPKKKRDDTIALSEMSTEETPLMRAKMSERCKFWPACINGNACQYHHPTVPCKTFPNCQYADKCLYIHPNCKYDSKCSRVDCPFTHASKRNTNTTVVQTVQQQILVPAVPQIPPQPQQKCKFYPNCKNLQCPFPHPKPCRFGAACLAKSNCPFYHPSLPSKDKLTWKSDRNQSDQETRGVLALF